jgi:hypothetical protein
LGQTLGSGKPVGQATLAAAVAKIADAYVAGRDRRDARVRRRTGTAREDEGYVPPKVL